MLQQPSLERTMLVALLAATVLMADSTTAMQAAPASSGPTTQGAAATTPEGAKPKTETADNKLICRNEPVLGSRLPTKRCRTASEAAQQRLDDQAALDRMQRRDLRSR